MPITITVNDIKTELDHDKTIIDLLAQLKQPLTGMALAVNQTILPKDEWATYQLKENDSIILFQAIAGG